MKNVINKIINVFAVLTGLSFLLLVIDIILGSVFHTLILDYQTIMETIFELSILGIFILGILTNILFTISEVMDDIVSNVQLSKEKGSNEVTVKVDKEDVENWYISCIDTYEKVGKKEVKFSVYLSKEPDYKYIDAELSMVKKKTHLKLKNRVYVCNLTDISKVTDEGGESVYIALIGVRAN